MSDTRHTIHKHLRCYRVTLPTTNCLHDTARMGESYIAVRDGTLYVMAADANTVASLWPELDQLELVGVGVALLPTPDGTDSAARFDEELGDMR